jgi:hypothetical protein
MSPVQRDQLTEAITGTFMWSFKKGDNIVYNLEIVWELYEAKSRSTDKRKYNKPIIVTLVSAIECMLDDFAYRIRGHVHDTVPNISQADIATFRTKKYDKLEHYIAASRRFNLFGRPTSFYDLLDELRKARNRVHIQNSTNQLAADEYNVFTDTLLTKTQQVFETVLGTMIVKFPRHGKTIAPHSVPLPWRV